MQRTIRKAEFEDAERLSRMRYKFRAAENPAVESRDEFVDRCLRWMRTRLHAEEERWRCWVAEQEERIVGHVWIQLVPKVPNPTREAEIHAYLTNNYVEPDRRRRGVGSALVKAAVDWCRQQGVDAVILWPTEDSRPLYRRFGFEPSGGTYELSLDAS